MVAEVDVYLACPVVIADHYHKVYSYRFEPRTLKPAEEVFDLLNSVAYREGMDPHEHDVIMPDHPLFPVIAEYRNEGWRSLSMMDIVGIKVEGGGMHFLRFTAVGTEQIHSFGYIE